MGFVSQGALGSDGGSKRELQAVENGQTAKIIRKLSQAWNYGAQSSFFSEMTPF